MTVEALIYARLSGFAGLAALVDDRIYPGKLPQDVAMPAVMYERIFDFTPQPQQLVGETDLIRARWQFNAYDQTYDGADAVRRQLRLALKRWATSGPPIVQVTFALGQFDLYEDDTRLHHLTADFEINYEE